MKKWLRAAWLVLCGRQEEAYEYTHVDVNPEDILAVQRERNERLTEWMRWQAFKGGINENGRQWIQFEGEPIQYILTKDDIHNVYLGDWVMWDSITWEGFQNARRNAFIKWWMREFNRAYRERLRDNNLYGFSAVEILPDGRRVRVDPARIVPHG